MDSSMYGAIIAIVILFLALMTLCVIAMWKLFKKAGEPGWACIVPVYSTIVMLRIVGKPWWWLFLFMIPLVGLIWAIWTVNMLSKSFGKDEGFTVGMLLVPLIFICILAFGDSKYQGPYGNRELYGAYRRKNGMGFDFESDVVEG